MTRTNNPALARDGTYPRKLEIGVLYGFRALMVLAVVNYHIWQQSWLSQRVSLLGLSTDFDFFTRSSYLFVDGMILLSGFLLYLPFLVIDLVVASILMSMGMMMLPPATISLPFKLIFFVLVDGWNLVAGSLVRSFGG